MFPSDNVWNTPITNLPVDSHSAAWLSSMNAGSTNLHPDFGPSGDPSNPYGMPYTVVPSGHNFVNIAFQYASESDPGPYPVPGGAPVEGGNRSDGDRHVLAVDRAGCKLYELYRAFFVAKPKPHWNADQGSVWDLNSTALRPEGWPPADAAGLPIFPGLVRYDEVAAGHLDHAIRVTFDSTRNAWVHPASHCAGDSDSPSAPPMGLRLRLA